MLSKSKKYPEEFPEGCPPIDASHTDIKLYRCVSQIPPQKKDFLSKFEEGKSSGIILAYGVSFFQNIKDAKTISSLPYMQKKGIKYLTSGTSHCEAGVLKHTPSTDKRSHHTYWFYEDVIRELLFSIES